MSNFADSALIFIIMLALAIAVVISMYLAGTISSAFIETGKFNATDIEPLNVTSYGAVKTFDYLSVFIVVGLGIGMIISAFYISSHPVFFVVMLVCQFVLIAISAAVSNIFYNVMSDPTLAATANELTWIPLIFNNMPLIILVLSGLAIIVSAGKQQASPYG